MNLAVGYGGRKEITDAMRSIVAAHHAEGRSLRTSPSASRPSSSASTSTPAASPTPTS